jgi:hypothetical protein
MFEARYLLMSLPALALLLAWLIVGIARLRLEPARGDPGSRLVHRWQGWLASRPVTRTLQLLAISLLAGVIVLRALQLPPSYGVSIEPWRGVTARILAASRPGDCIAFYPLDTRMPFRYYLPADEAAPRPVLPVLPWGQVRPFVEDYATLSRQRIDRLPTFCTRVWLVASHQGHHDGTAAGKRNWDRFLALSTAIGHHYFRSKTTMYGAARLITVVLYSEPLAPSRSGHGPATS